MSQKPLVSLSRSIENMWIRRAYQVVSPLVENFLGIEALNASYERVLADQASVNFFESAMNAMALSYTVSDEDLAKIPTTGPVMVVSNHPYGGIDGVILGALLSRVRPDYKVIANYLLGMMEAMQPWLIPVDPFGGPDAKRKNFASMKEAIRCLKAGQCLATFPSGTVSHLHIKQRRVVDPVWLENTSKLIHKGEATVVPIYFEGHNSAFFQLAGVLHPRLRTLLLPREMKRMHHANLHLRIGQPIPYRKIAGYQDGVEMMSFLRLKTYLLANRTARQESPSLPHQEDVAAVEEVEDEEAFEPLAPAIEPTLLAQDVAQLPAECCLVEHGHYHVYCAKAAELPHVLPEIGRLREKTFREVFEGTGKRSDLDAFDDYYYHLFLWDAEALKIVGAYRLGLSDQILDQYGKRGLYTSTLFNYRSEFLERLNPALEVGRSFIVSEYQKKHASLSLIWRGIGQFVVRNPRYKTLLGPVSINREYLSISQDLMVKFLRKHSFDGELSPLVKAKHPPRRMRGISGTEKKALLNTVKSIDEVSALISEVEKDGKGIPVLLRHYLKLNGRLVSFNVDNAFGRCLDGLIIVDLTQSDPKLLKNYLTPEGLESFLSFHRAPITSKA